MFRVTFHDGPLAGDPANERHMAAPGIPRRLYLTPAPEGTEQHAIGNWLLVGYDDVPMPPWPGQVTYELDDELSSARTREEIPGFRDGEDQGIAVYREVTDAAD